MSTGESFNVGKFNADPEDEMNHINVHSAQKLCLNFQATLFLTIFVQFCVVHVEKRFGFLNYIILFNISYILILKMFICSIPHT